jgi:hypothetical protein
LPISILLYVPKSGKPDFGRGEVPADYESGASTPSTAPTSAPISPSITFG